MVLPKEREAVDKNAFTKEKIGVDTIIENLAKHLPEIGKLEPVSTTYDENTKKYRVVVKEKLPDANTIGPVVMSVMSDFFGLTGDEFDQQKYKEKIRKDIAENKKLFKKGGLIDVEIVEHVEDLDGKLYISPGWIEAIRKAEEKRALQEKAAALATEVWSAQGHEGSIFRALELYRELIKLDHSDKKITSVNCDCELLDESGQRFHSEITQIYQTVEPGSTIESWAMFDSDAGAKRKGIRLKIVNVTLK